VKSGSKKGKNGEKGKRGAGSGEWGVGARKSLFFPHSPFPIPHSPHSLFASAYRHLYGGLQLSVRDGKRYGTGSVNDLSIGQEAS
jgi:hypothetical protein